MQILCLKYRLFPTKQQAHRLADTLETCRLVYNSLLNDRKFEYELHGKSPSCYEQQKMFPKWSKQFPDIANVHSQVLQNIAVRVDRAFQAFFRRAETGQTTGFPRVKGEGYDSFCYPQSGFRIGKGAVSLSLFGKQERVKAKLHRPIVGKIKTCCIHRIGSKWFACFSVEQADNFLPPSTFLIGLDAGLNSFLALSDGAFVDNPRCFRRDEKALAKAQRKLGKQVRGSHRRQKARCVARRIHERIRNRRHNFVHQTARRMIDSYGIIAVEKLNVSGMVKNHRLAKSISDAAWSMFRSVLTHKAESAGRQVIAINPAFTSQDCSACGHRPDGGKGLTKKTLKDRWHFCRICGLSLDRDTNAAINILQTAVGQHSVG